MNNGELTGLSEDMVTLKTDVTVLGRILSEKRRLLSDVYNTFEHNFSSKLGQMINQNYLESSNVLKEYLYSDSPSDEEISDLKKRYGIGKYEFTNLSYVAFTICDAIQNGKAEFRYHTRGLVTQKSFQDVIIPAFEKVIKVCSFKLDLGTNENAGKVYVTKA